MMRKERRNTAVEQRLRRVFAQSEAGGLVQEGAATPGEDPQERDVQPGRAERLDAALAHLRLLTTNPWLEADPYLRGHDRGEVQAHLDIAQDIVERLKDDRALPDRAGMPFVAELMIISDGTRPATLVQKGTINAAEMGEFGDLFERFMPDALQSIAATGRIEVRGQHLGTGVLVWLETAGRLAVLTARHVAWQLPSLQAHRGPVSIDFDGEFGSFSSNSHVLASVLAMGASSAMPDDWALLGLVEKPSAATPLASLPIPTRLDQDDHAFEPPRRLAVVSYPGKPSLAEQLRWKSPVWNRIFCGIWHVKRLSPAYVVSDQPPAALVFHDATTTIGSSGGAMLSIGTGSLGGIHCGAPHKACNWGLSLHHIGTQYRW